MADYGINIGVNVQSSQLGRLTQQLKELRKIEQDLIELQKDGLVTQKDSNNLRRKARDEISKNKKAALDAAKAFNSHTGILQKGTAALREQEKQLRSYRAGAKKAKDGWTTFTQAIAKTNFSAAFSELKQLDKEAKATAKALQLMAQGGGGLSFAKGASIKDLVAFAPANTTDAMRSYSNVLESVIGTVDRASVEYKELAQRIREVNDEMMRVPVPTTQYNAPIGPKRRRNVFQSTRFRDIATGAGFPLLFGGGPIQALAGGAVGGLGGAIAASAAVSQIEAFAVSAAQAGQALQSTGGALEFVREKSLFSSEQAEDLAAKLEQQGKVQELATFLTDQLTEVIGTSGLIALQDLGATTDKTTKLWNQLTTQRQILISGPLNGFLELVNKILGGITEGLKPTAQQDFVAVRDKILRSGTAEQIAQIQAIEAQVRGTVSRNVRGGAFGGGTQAEMGVLGEAQALKGLELAEQAGLMPKIAVTPKDLRTIAPPKERERESRVPQLTIEVGLTERLNALNKQILQAKQDEDLVREAALSMEIELEKQAAKIAKINLDKIPQAEKDLQIKQVSLETDQEIFKINEKVKTSRQAQAEKNKEIIANFQSQNNLLQAQLEGRLEEEQIEQQLKKLKEDNKNLDVEKIRSLLEANNVLKDQIAIAERLDQVYASIGQSITTGIVDALTSAIEGTKSLADVAGQTLRQVASTLLQFGVQASLSGIPGLDKFFPGRALGGSVSANKPYMVGERGPELFVPGAQGNIVPNNSMGSASIVVNVDASGTQAQGNQPNAKALGAAIGAAVQAELVKQKRPGGLLS